MLARNRVVIKTHRAALGTVLATAAIGLVLEAMRGAREEAKDTLLTEELRAAAAASAAYEGTPEKRQLELNTRGVDSGNWRVDPELSSEAVGVFVNAHTQEVIVAFRGTATLGDWGSNLRRIVPGDEANSPSFKFGLEAARRARDKYLLYRSILLTGHSRGGAMADFVGRKLGLPSATFNPATWGKVIRGQEEPARRSVTSKTPADLVSLLEAFMPGDRDVTLRMPKNLALLLFLPCLGAACIALAWLLGALSAACMPSEATAWACRALGETRSGGAVLLGGVEVLLLVAWLQRVGVLCAALTVAVLVFGSHSVLHFTVK